MSHKIIEPFAGHPNFPPYVSNWLERLRVDAAVVDRVVATVAVPVLAAGAIVQALVTIADVEQDDIIVGAVYQRQPALYAASPWITFDVWVYGAGQVYMTFYSPAGGGGVNVPYEFFVLKAKQTGR